MHLYVSARCESDGELLTQYAGGLVVGPELAAGQFGCARTVVVPS